MTWRTWRPRLAPACAILALAAGALGVRASALPSLSTKASTCSVGFVASVRTGPGAGTNYQGALMLRLDAAGRVVGATFRPLGGSKVSVVATVRGRSVDLRIPTVQGTLHGTGRMIADLRRCFGTMSGSLSGPRRQSRGDWLASTGDLQGPYYSSPPDHAIYDTDAGMVYAGIPHSPGFVDAKRRQAKFNMPSGIDLDTTRSLMYVADVGNAVIRRIDQSSGQVTTVLRASTVVAAAAAAGFPNVTGWEPHGVGVDASGNLFISDAGNNVMWYYNFAMTKLRLLAGRPGSAGAADGVGTNARWNGPDLVGMNVDRTIANVTDRNNCLLRQVTKNGEVFSFGPTTGCH